MCCVHNIILGKLWIEQYGTVEIVNHRYRDKYCVPNFKPFYRLGAYRSTYFFSIEFLSTGDKCVLNFKPCGMFGKELHKVEGYIQDKRWEHNHTVNNQFLVHFLWNKLDVSAVEPVRRSGGWSMGSGQSACTAWTTRCMRRIRSRTRRREETPKSWDKWVTWRDVSRVKLPPSLFIHIFYLSYNVTWICELTHRSEMLFLKRYLFLSQ